ncbi:hypothetical protein ABTX81_06150 [Kitasatospora sp. NPDC097605]|uniref:hypothetical protein n=1 Tax=Kitasatospora sp. NPDC097605 TaxID=3157226 RepID=UPI0033247866
MVLGVAALAAVVASAVPGGATANAVTVPDESALTSAITDFIASVLAGVTQATDGARSENWGVITRNTIGSPVAALRNGPFGSYGATGDNSRPPYGNGSLGIEVADAATSQTPGAEKVDFGNEVDFFGQSVQDLDEVGFHVFQTTENVGYGGGRNLPNIRFEIDPNLGGTQSDNYSVLVWQPDAVPVASLNRWSPYLDATTTGSWYLTGGETSCTQATPCSFTDVKRSLNDGGNDATILTAAVSKGRDYLWVGAVDGLRINQFVYDFEANGVNARRVDRT